MKPQLTAITSASHHKVVSREEWLAARIELLKDEKELTRRTDAVALKRQALPWVRIDKEYLFETENGPKSLRDLFQGRSQLIVYHFMFGPDFTAGCPSCSSIADGFNGVVHHLANHDVTLSAVSRAPLAKLQAYKKQKGWTFPWASSNGSDFNFDFHVSFTSEQIREGADYNFRRDDPVMNIAMAELREESVPAQHAAMTGTDVGTYTDAENPALQVIKYIEAIREGREKNRKGRPIEVTPTTHFYCYIMCDITEKLRKILKRIGFLETPDGQGLFHFAQNYNAYIEVASYNKMLRLAEQRNRILFEKLQIK